MGLVVHSAGAARSHADRPGHEGADLVSWHGLRMPRGTGGVRVHLGTQRASGRTVGAPVPPSHQPPDHISAGRRRQGTSLTVRMTVDRLGPVPSPGLEVVQASGGLDLCVSAGVVLASDSHH